MNKKDLCDIKTDSKTNEIYVIGKEGKEIFRISRTEDHKELAWLIYMGEKYG